MLPTCHDSEAMGNVFRPNDNDVVEEANNARDQRRINQNFYRLLFCALSLCAQSVIRSTRAKYNKGEKSDDNDIDGVVE